MCLTVGSQSFFSWIMNNLGKMIFWFFVLFFLITKGSVGSAKRWLYNYLGINNEVLGTQSDSDLYNQNISKNIIKFEVGKFWKKVKAIGVIEKMDQGSFGFRVFWDLRNHDLVDVKAMQKQARIFNTHWLDSTTSCNRIHNMTTPKNQYMFSGGCNCKGCGYKKNDAVDFLETIMEEGGFRKL